MLVILGTLYYTVSFQGASMVEAGTMFGLLYMAYQKSVVIPMAYQKFLSSSGAIKVYETITEELEKYPDPYNNKGNIAPDFTRPILIDNISFSYPNAETPTINKLAMTIPPRESIAIVGESGSGKSTLANILTALAKPQDGALSINGQTYDELDIPSLRSSIGYITQESVVFNDTVKNNITLWENNADMDKVMAAAKKAHAHDFIMDMPDGYDTMLGDDGVNISGGQRQRLTIARELYRDPPIIIFDEATSSLDSATEENIQREIDEMRGERTIVIIAHRLSTIRNCDTIFVMEKGEIVESGTYEALVSKKGKFHEMIKRQNLAGAE
jgi:ABC-type multidrug transport system fused ATPase/permease subunit